MTKEDVLFFLGRFRTKRINEKLYDALGVAIKALKQPEIIRCEDCKYYKTTGNFKTYCDEENFPDEGQKELPEWWFCAGGKRKGEDV